MKYVVEVNKNGKWKKHSDHVNIEFAIINRDVQKTMGLKARIKYAGAVIDDSMQDMQSRTER